MAGSIVTGELTFSSNLTRIAFYALKLISRIAVAKNTDLVFAKTREIESYLKHNFNIPPSKTRIIPLGVYSSLFSGDKATRMYLGHNLEISQDSFVLVYSGKIVPRQGIDVLIRAASISSNTEKFLRLVIVGTGEDEYLSELWRMTKPYGIEDRFIWIDWVHRTELAKYYGLADIAIWPGAPSISIV